MDKTKTGYQDAINVIKSNYPDSSYSLLREALDLAIGVFQEKIEDSVKNTAVSDIMNIHSHPTMRLNTMMKRFHRGTSCNIKVYIQPPTKYDGILTILTEKETLLYEFHPNQSSPFSKIKLLSDVSTWINNFIKTLYPDVDDIILSVYFDSLDIGLNSMHTFCSSIMPYGIKIAEFIDINDIISSCKGITPMEAYKIERNIFKRGKGHAFTRIIDEKLDEKFYFKEKDKTRLNLSSVQSPQKGQLLNTTDLLKHTICSNCGHHLEWGYESPRSSNMLAVCCGKMYSAVPDMYKINITNFPD